MFVNNDTIVKNLPAMMLINVWKVAGQYALSKLHSPIQPFRLRRCNLEILVAKCFGKWNLILKTGGTTMKTKKKSMCKELNSILYIQMLYLFIKNIINNRRLENTLAPICIKSHYI